MRKPWILIAVLTVTLLGSAITPIRADELSDAIAKQRKLEQQQERARGQLQQLKVTEDQKKKQLNQIGNDIVVAKANLAQKEQAYAEAQADVEAAEKELLTKQEELDNRRDSLRKRVRGIYEEGSLSYLEVLFQSSDLGDFITRMEYYGKIVENDQQLLTDIQDQKMQIAQKTQELKERRDQVAKLKEQAVLAKSTLDNKLGQERMALAEVKNAQEDLFTQIEKLEKDSKSLEDVIRKLQAARSNGVIGTVGTWPVPGHYTISSPFGWRIHPITRKRSMHTGVDIPAPRNTPIVAAGAGTVIFAGWYGAYGNAIIIDHGKGYSTLYGHQNGFAISNGQQVKAGQKIGYIGTTGWSTGPHLHFEVRLNGNPTDPLLNFR